MAFLTIGNKFGTRFSWLLFLMLSSFIVSIVVSFLVIKLEGINPFILMDVSSAIASGNLGILKLFQIIQSVFLFIIPAWVFAYFIEEKPWNFLSLSKKAHANSFFLVTVLMLLMFPVNNYIAEWNRNIVFPESLAGLHDWMLQKETMLAEITEQFLKINSPSDFIVNFLMIAIIPAIGEELMFRGVIQRLFIDFTKNSHWGIWIAAFLFSAIHMEFLTFIPRFFLGALFGYLYVWSRSLWLPILAHFINNGLAVILSALEQTKSVSPSVETIGQQEGTVFIAGIAALMAIGVIYLIYRQEKYNYRG